MQSSSCLREPKPSKYDVHVSSDKITSLGFAGHLGKGLADAGFSICKDEEGIGKSRVFIVVFSQQFADSSDQLDELVTIKEFAKANRRPILPIFYRVPPSDVRRQRGEYGKALAAYKNNVDRIRLDGWIGALIEIADMVGKHIEWVVGGKDESQYIEEMIQDVNEHVPCRIGLHPRVEKVIRYLDSGYNHRVQVVAICGDPGSGRTTVARGVYDCYADNRFDYYCIIDKGGEYLSEQGLLHLQRMLYSRIVGGNFTEFENVKEIRSVLEQKKIFLILEDIDLLEQLEGLDDLTSLFALGSKVIITVTAQQRSLLEGRGIRETYDVEIFSDAEAREFLCLKFLKSSRLKSNNMSMIISVANIASRFPLDLEMIGSNLCGNRMGECKSLMIPNLGIREILQVIFDDLDENHRLMLIYIARNLKGQELVAVENALAGSFDGCSREHMKVLRKKSFIKINEHGQVTLHDSILEWILQKEYTENGKWEVQPAISNIAMQPQPQFKILDQSMICDQTELELSYQHCSSSFSQDAL